MYGSREQLMVKFNLSQDFERKFLIALIIFTLARRNYSLNRFQIKFSREPIYEESTLKQRNYNKFNSHLCVSHQCKTNGRIMLIFNLLETISHKYVARLKRKCIQSCEFKQLWHTQKCELWGSFNLFKDNRLNDLDSNTNEILKSN